MNRWLRVLSPDDARTVVFGVLSVLVLVTAVTRWTSPEARLFRFLKTVPAFVLAVVIEPEHPETVRSLVGQFLGIPDAAIRSGARPAATLLVDRGSGEHAVVLFEQDSLANKRGSSVMGFAAVGDDAAVALLRSWEGRSPTVPASVLRFLRQPVNNGVRVLVRLPLLARRLPPDVLQGVPDSLLALTLEAAGRRVVIRGLLPGDVAEGAPAAGVLLQRPPPDSLVLLDGIPASQLLPESLPPLLQALKAESGVTHELDALARALGESPGVISVRRGPAGTTEIVVGFDTKGRPPEAVKAAARALLQRRLELVGAVTERVRVGDRVIRHRRPRSPDVARPRSEPALSLGETLRDGWSMLRAPLGAGAADLVAAVNDTSAIFGTSEEAVLAVAHGFGGEEQVHNLRFFADAEHLREVPVVVLALRGLPERLRVWLEALETVHGEFDAGAAALRFEGSAEFSPNIPGGGSP